MTMVPNERLRTQSAGCPLDWYLFGSIHWSFGVTRATEEQLTRNISSRSDLRYLIVVLFKLFRYIVKEEKVFSQFIHSDTISSSN